MRACAIIPAYRAARTVGEVVRETRALWPLPDAVIVVDDGSDDDTAEIARAAGAVVLSHPNNRGKGAALRTGMRYALAHGFQAAVTLDADAQHPPAEARRLVDVEPDPGALVLGIRDLVRAGAPRANQMSNRISNFFLSLFCGRPLADTQCGLRRYPLEATLALGGQDDGYAFEAEVILRAVAAGLPIVEVPIQVIYPPAHERVTHFDSVRDPARIIFRVLATLASVRLDGKDRPASRASVPPSASTVAPPPVSARKEAPRAGAATL
jgi:glycosyltransferase involved in cell wall biosynthesis